MLTQQEYDMANIEAEVEIQQLIAEWFRDYLGPRGIENGVQNAGYGGEGSAGANIQAPAGPEAPNPLQG